MEAFYRTHAYLVEHTNAPVRRDLMDEIDWNDRLIGIKGTRGVGKTTFLLQYAKEKFGTDRSCLFINMNNFYFSGHSIVDFAYEFQRRGGKVLLIDQVFKKPDWSQELRACYDRFPNLKIVFTGSSVMRLKEENHELRDIVKSYNLRGFSFREFLNLQTGMKFHAYTLEEILSNHEQIAKGILSKVRPLDYFQDYMHHGFYPFFLEKRNFSENLLKTMNMMVEVDILLIKQIELKYLSKIKKLLYLLAVDGPKAPNVSQLANDIQTSRATVMNYIKYLADARLINMVYPKGEEFPKKPTKIMMHNSNLMYSIYPVKVEEQDVLDTFFVNTLWKDHKVNKGDKNISFMVDEVMPFKICCEGVKIKNNPGVTYALHKAEIGRGNQIPLWLFGFLY
ncbi:MAG: AAA family ATPase [Bacteroides sp.]|nr:AAA family ATPase [Bacteroides sp.]